MVQMMYNYGLLFVMFRKGYLYPTVDLKVICGPG